MSTTGAALRAAERREPERSLPLLALRIAVVLLSLLVLGRAAQMLRPALDRPVQQVQVAGRLSHLTPMKIAIAAAVAPGTHLFTVNLQAVQARVESLPWVAQAQVTRDWPDSLSVQVIERRPFARWGAHALLDSDGRAFTPAPGDLSTAQWQAMPQLAGPKGQEQDVMQAWKQLSVDLAGTPFTLAQLSQDARGDWSAQTRSGVMLRLGQDDPASKLKLLRNTIPRALVGKLDQVAAVDLRYTNGFAVKWVGTSGPSANPPETARVVEKPKS